MKPVIFHDHMLGIYPHLEVLFQQYERGMITPEVFREAISIDGKVPEHLHVSFLCQLAYRAWGQQTFCVGPTLQEMFENTSLKGIPFEEYKLPYDAFYVAFVDCPWKLWGGPDTQWHDLTGAMVAKAPASEYPKAPEIMYFYLWGQENDRSINAGDDASFWFSLNLDRGREEGLDMEQHLDEVFKKTDRETPQGLADITMETARKATRTILNMCLYHSSEGADLVEDEEYRKQREERKRLLKEIKKVQEKIDSSRNRKKLRRREKERDNLLDQMIRNSEAVVTWLGRSVEPTSDPKPRVAGQRREHWVRGHWWPKVSSGKPRRWVQPYLRCKDSGEAVPARIYRTE